MKKYKIVHKITADFIAEAIVNEDEIDTSINDLRNIINLIANLILLW